MTNNHTVSFVRRSCNEGRRSVIFQLPTAGCPDQVLVRLAAIRFDRLPQVRLAFSSSGRRALFCWAVWTASGLMRSLWPVVAHQEIASVWRERETPELIVVSFDFHLRRATRLAAVEKIEFSFVPLDAEEIAAARSGPVDGPYAA